MSILKPLKPTLKIIENQTFLKLNTSQSLIGSVVHSITDQSRLLQEKEREYKEQVNNILSIICSAVSLTDYVKNKLEYLSEEIEDINSKNNQTHLNKTPQRNDIYIEEIQDIISVNEKEINSVLYGFNKILYLLEFRQKQNYQISEILNSNLKLDKKLINNQVSFEDDRADKIINYEVSIHKSIFDMMVEEILKFDSANLQMNRVNILEDKKVEFVFAELNKGMMSEHERLVLCRLWGIFNNIKITIEYHTNTMKIVCKFD